jgi:outer membrane murein-binding lipoprotein Lpp
MTVTPKIDPRKDRTPLKKAPRMAGIYAVWAIVALGAMSAAGSTYIWRDGKAPLSQMPLAAAPMAPQVVANPQSEREINRLNDAVRVLASERDRLSTRLEQLERSVGDITATIPQQKKAPPIVVEEPFAPPPAPSVQVITPPNPEPRPQGHNQLMPQQLPQTTTTVVTTMPPVASAESTESLETTNTTRTVFGVDLGGEKTVDGLRARWATLRGNHGSTLDGMRPLISVKEGQKAGTVELRLVVGPLANAAAAARVCARLQTSGVPCIPTVFDGQRLSLR